MEEELKQLKSTLKALVVSSPTTMDVRTLLRDFRNMVGGPLPLAKYGYRDPVDFLRERCGDCFLLQGMPSNPILTLIVSENLKHIDKFVQKQRVAGKNKGKRRSVPESIINPPAINTNLICRTFNKNRRPVTRNSSNFNHNNKPLQMNSFNNSLTNNMPLTRNDPLLTNNSKAELKNDTRTNELEYVSSENFPPSGVHTASKEDEDIGKQSSSSQSSSSKRARLDELKEQIFALIQDSEDGIWCTDIISLYRERYGRELKFNRFGYTSVISLAYSLEGRVAISRPEPNGDWLLQEASRSTAAAAPPAPAGRRRGGSAGRVPRGVREAPRDPDDALPGVDFEADVFPADCLHYLEKVPAASLADMAAGAVLEVVVGEVYSPSHFWMLRVGERHNLAMEDIMDEMTEYYSRGAGAARQLARGAVRLGHYCSSEFERDWHRALIVHLVDSDTVKVRHVDYGTVDTVPVSGLKPLLRRWAELPAQAVRARLAGCRPGAGGRRWPRAACAAFLNCVRQRRLYAKIVAVAHEEDIVETFLVDTSGPEDVCITRELVRAEHADARPDSALRSGDAYLYPRFEALESGATPNYAEIHRYLRDGIALEYVEAYRRHVPPAALLPPPPATPAPALTAPSDSSSTSATEESRTDSTATRNLPGSVPNSKSEYESGPVPSTTEVERDPGREPSPAPVPNGPGVAAASGADEVACPASAVHVRLSAAEWEVLQRLRAASAWRAMLPPPPGF